MNKGIKKNNLISNNYKHIANFEEKVKNAGHEKEINNSFLNNRFASNDNFKKLSKMKQIEYLKNLVNQIKNIYNK